MSETPYNRLVDFTEVDRLTDVLLGRPTIPPKPIYTPMIVRPPKGFEKYAEEVETPPHERE